MLSIVAFGNVLTQKSRSFLCVCVWNYCCPCLALKCLHQGGKIPEESSSNHQRFKHQQQQQRHQKPLRKQGPGQTVQMHPNRDGDFSLTRMRERERCKRFSDAFLELRRRVAPFNEKLRRNSTGNEIRQEGINENGDKVKNRNAFLAPEYGYEISK